MSYWTEIILTASCLEDTGSEDGPSEFPPLVDINRIIAPFGLFEIKNPDPTRHSPFGCFAGYVKNLNCEVFVVAVRTAPWQCLDEVQLFLRGENDDKFVEIALDNPAK